MGYESSILCDYLVNLVNVNIYHLQISATDHLLTINDIVPGLLGVGINSGMDYWNGTLDWTTGLNYFPFWDKFLYIFPST